MEIYKLLAVCLLAAVLAAMLHRYKAEYALAVSLGAGAVILLYLVKSIAAPVAQLQKSLEQYGVRTEYFKTALKALLIGYLTGFIADACRDSGQASLAAKAELAGKCAVFLLSWPLILSILQTAVGFLS